MKILKNLVSGMCLLIISTLLTACNSKINQDNYEKVHAGMTFQDVTQILGEPTNTAGLSFGNVIGLSASWEDRHGSITIQFFDNKVKIKNFNQAVK